MSKVTMPPPPANSNPFKLSTSNASQSPKFQEFASELQKCLSIRHVKEFHARFVKTNFSDDVFLVTRLAHRHLTCGNLVYARRIFDKMKNPPIFLWNEIIKHHSRRGLHQESLNVFRSMLESGVHPNEFTFTFVLPACAAVKSVSDGYMIHSLAIRRNLDSNSFVATALVDMYAKAGKVFYARKLFDKMPQKVLASYNAMIGGYAINEQCEKAMEIFDVMLKEGVEIDAVTMVSLLQACAYVGALQRGRWIHQHGILTGFSHGGMVEKGRQYFNLMSESYGLCPGLEHYSCMVDMLGRAGKLEEAEELVKSMTVNPDAGVWGGLLNACRIHKNVKIAERVVDELLRLEPENAGWYVSMSNVYAAAKQWDGVVRMRLMMKERGITKPPGWSSIEVSKRIHRFTVFDRSHPRSDAIYRTLNDLEERMRKMGYVAEMNCVLGNFEEGGLKEDLLCGHSERLAIAFGILSTPSGEVLRIIKNLRVCVDCHTATKYITRIAEREIIVRDAKRFHHFKDGKCSCGDYW
ncbi:Pentatricopeptide repeat-containing protein [Nymphaea thermarum]|nr:Pentatricopeptide repeat-containing protein [Nymphaea thermarum]